MRTRRILIIDDMDANRYVLRKILASEPRYEVIEASNGAEGLARLDAHVDLAILDVNLPDMTGFELVRAAEEKLGSEHMPAIINVSATFISGSDKAMGLNNGARAYLTHPIDAEEMLATITSLMKSNNRLERIERRRKMAVARSESLRSEKITLERFMRSFSHDLRSPLAAATMAAGLMKRNPARRTEELIKVVEDNLKRIDRMITNVLDVSHVAIGGGIELCAEMLDLHALLAEASENLRLQVAQPVELHLGGAAQVHWDRNAFLRIYDNLVINAAKHGAQDTPIDVEQLLRDDEVLLRVTNHGAFPDEVLANLATPYFISTRSDTKGWGLGLPIVKALCESFGGTVNFHNHAPLACVEVCLPLRLASAS
ncbi:response regulator [Pseudomonas typographi]|uniref:histidine kinase n=1 Tax=Pseudomonas typographi TaxID=2715964 RepID=A0ABR7YXD2_9PSED|nr:response regulator [Pseudomonas typographi]MBD1550940.1 hybrid sensor histidine kinase/response regulator [Pseudomonas typographi]MBD1585765.1 hybrid sensor histidine kinase/response regulator [Pseudomonas typographi]MBD1597839.1 hybrid sensor histidine kinase/response regulator [Pseudomonas typographi]